MIEENQQLVEVETGRVVVARLERARSLWQRSVGLLGRSRLEPNTGLWLKPCNGIHTFAMRFPIDVLVLDREGHALRLVSNLSPWRICAPVRGGHSVVELPAGTLVEQNIRTGARYVSAEKTVDSKQ